LHYSRCWKPCRTVAERTTQRNGSRPRTLTLTLTTTVGDPARICVALDEQIPYDLAHST
jgi:hypothetical protein